MRGRKHDILFFQCVIQEQIKKESPNEGTETYFAHLGFFGIHPDKKRIPE